MRIRQSGQCSQHWYQTESSRGLLPNLAWQQSEAALSHRSPAPNADYAEWLSENDDQERHAMAVEVMDWLVERKVRL